MATCPRRGAQGRGKTHSQGGRPGLEPRFLTLGPGGEGAGEIVFWVLRGPWPGLPWARLPHRMGVSASCVGQRWRGDDGPSLCLPTDRHAHVTCPSQCEAWRAWRAWRVCQPCFARRRGSLAAVTAAAAHGLCAEAGHSPPNPTTPSPCFLLFQMRQECVGPTEPIHADITLGAQVRDQWGQQRTPCLLPLPGTGSMGGS